MTGFPHACSLHMTDALSVPILGREHLSGMSWVQQLCDFVSQKLPLPTGVAVTLAPLSVNVLSV